LQAHTIVDNTEVDDLGMCVLYKTATTTQTIGQQ